MAGKGFYSDWCDEQLNLYHAPRATGDPMVDWQIFDQQQKRIWKEINEGNGKYYGSGSYSTEKESCGGGITLGQVCILLAVVIAMDWFLFTSDRDWSLLGILLLTVVFLGTIFGLYIWFEHMNQKEAQEKQEEQSKKD